MSVLITLTVAVLIHVAAAQIFGVTPTTFACQSLFSFYPHETDCSRFYRCFWGQAHEFVCPPNTKWNQRILTCDHAYNVPCATAIVAKPVFEDWHSINNINDDFAKPPVPPPSVVKETIVQPPQIIARNDFKNLAPTRQYPNYDPGFIKTPAPSRQRPTVDTGFVNFPGQNDYNVPNTVIPTLGRNDYLYNFVNRPYRKSMWYASAGFPSPTYNRPRYGNSAWDLGFRPNSNYARPNIKFVRVRDPVVGRYFGRKAWKK